MNTQLVTVNNGIASTTSLIVAEQFGRRHQHVLRTLDKISKDRPNLGLISIPYIDNMNRHKVMYELAERQALITMPFIGGTKSFDGQITLVDAFLALRDHIKGGVETAGGYDINANHEARLSRLEQQLITSHKAVLAVDNANDQYAHTIKIAIKSSGKIGITASCLYEQCRRIPKTIKEKLINDYIELGNIFTLMIKLNGSNRSSLVYYWRK